MSAVPDAEHPFALGQRPQRTGAKVSRLARCRDHPRCRSRENSVKYGVKRLVWYRDYRDVEDAIADEKRIKKWRRKWKLELIETMNPGWDDLYERLNV